MNNFTLANKKALEVLIEEGHVVMYDEYNPEIEQAPVTPVGFSIYYTESAATLVEFIYIK